MTGSRWVGLLAAGSAVVALAIPGPVSAADTPVVVRPAMANLTISGEITPPVYLRADTDFLSNVEMVFDLAGVAGVATTRFDPSCTTNTTVATCRFSGAVMQDGLFGWRSLLSIAPVEGASPGSHGTIVITASADNASTGSHSVEVTVEDPGVGLRMVYPGESRSVRTTARAGDLVELPLRAATGARPINGSAVVLDLSPLLYRTDDYSNCRYLSAGPLVCTFDTVLQPHTVYQLAIPLKLQADPAFHEVFGKPANVPGEHANGAFIRVPGLIIFRSTPPGCQYTPEQPPLPGLPIPPSGNYFWCPTGPLLRAGHTAWFNFDGTLHSRSSGSITINQPTFGDVRVDPNPDDDHATINLTQIPAAQ